MDELENLKQLCQSKLSSLQSILQQVEADECLGSLKHELEERVDEMEKVVTCLEGRELNKNIPEIETLKTLYNNKLNNLLILSQQAFISGNIEGYYEVESKILITRMALETLENLNAKQQKDHP